MATIIQSKFGAGVDALSSSATTYSFDSPVTTGNAVVVVVAVGAEPTDCTASDATNGSYTNHVEFGESGTGSTAAILAKRNVVGGFTQVAVTSSTTGNGVVWLFEVSGLDTTASPSTGSVFNASGTTNHVSASVGLMGTGFAVCGAMLGAGGTVTQGSGWTLAATPSAARFCQYRVTAVSADQGDFTADPQSSSAVMAVFSNAAPSTTDGAIVFASTSFA